MRFVGYKKVMGIRNEKVENILLKFSILLDSYLFNSIYLLERVIR